MFAIARRAITKSEAFWPSSAAAVARPFRKKLRLG